MNLHVGRTPERKSQAVASIASGRRIIGECAIDAEDNRPEAAARGTLQKIINSSRRVQQLKSASETANQSPHVRQLKAYQAAGHASGQGGTGLRVTADLDQDRLDAEAPGKEGPIQRVIRIGTKRLKSRKNISQLWRAHGIDERLGLEPEEKYRFQRVLLRLAEGTNTTEFADWDQAFARLKEPAIVIEGDDGVASLIKSTTDLAIWLGSYPLRSDQAPRHYADTAILQTALSSLHGLKTTITNRRVWRAVIAAAEGTGSGAGAGGVWGELELVDSFNLLGEREEAVVPGRYRRKLPEAEYNEKLQALRSSLAGYRFVGLHATTMERTGSLVKEGVNPALFNTGHGAGKGRGFYIIPAAGVSNKLLKLAKGWGGHVVAVFLPDSAEEVQAGKLDNVQTLERANKARKPFYYFFGESEAVIPPSLCTKVKIVVDPSDISMGSTEYEAEAYADEFAFMKEILVKDRGRRR